jgi:hypothetical protein
VSIYPISSIKWHQWFSDLQNAYFNSFFTANTDADTDSAASEDDFRIPGHPSASTSADTIPPNRQLSSAEIQERRVKSTNSLDSLLREIFSDQSSEEGDKTLTEPAPGNINEILTVKHYSQMLNIT